MNPAVGVKRASRKQRVHLMLLAFGKRRSRCLQTAPDALARRRRRGMGAEVVQVSDCLDQLLVEGVCRRILCTGRASRVIPELVEGLFPRV